MIRCNDPLAQYRLRQPAIDGAMRRVLESGRFLHGDEVPAFEQEFAAYLGVSEVVAVANGTTALWLALKACDIGPGDQVITCSYTAVGTVAAIELAGAEPVLIDVEPDLFTLDTSLLRAALSPCTKAIVPVHLFGQPADMEALGQFAVEHGLRVIEDCAQAHGARWSEKQVGILGDVSCFSFYPTKNLGALGDAGAVATRDPSIAEKVRGLREFGWSDDRTSHFPGGNARMDELQAAVLRARLPNLNEDNRTRQRLAEVYRERLRGLPCRLPAVRVGAEHIYHQFVIQAQNRGELRDRLRSEGVIAEVHYPVPVHLQPAYQGRISCASSMDVSESLAANALSLPIHPGLSVDQVRLVADSVTRFYSGISGIG